MRWRNRLFHRFLSRASSRYVEGTREGTDVLRKLYPQHLYDPVRRRMAVELGGKEIAKILDAKNNLELSRIRRSVAHIFDTREDVYAPVHDFWSFTEMVLHIKKKELPELITASNVQWKKQTTDLGELSITWMPFLERNPDIFGKKPWKVSELQRIFSESPDLLREAKQDQIDIVGYQQHKFKQSNEPITVIDRGNGLETVDGNGRLYHAVLAKRKKIHCYIGQQRGPVPIEYWVSSGTLKQLCLEIRDYAHSDPEGFDAGITYIRTKLRNNRIALTNYHLYLRNDFPEFEKHLGDLLPQKKS